MQTKHLNAEIKSTKDEGPGSFEAVLSMPTLDRDGEIIDPDAFLPLPKRITIDIDHGLSAKDTIGSGVPYYDNDVLMIRATFASTPDAQEMRAKVLEGHVGHVSVAYRAAKYEIDENDGLPHLRKAELLNAAIVSIPSNREAAILVAKAIEKIGARNSSKDQERIQHTHDHMVELGATCGEKHVHAAEPKSADTDTPTAPVDTTAPAGAEVEVGKALLNRATAIAARARAQLLLDQ